MGSALLRVKGKERLSSVLASEDEDEEGREILKLREMRSCPVILMVASHNAHIRGENLPFLHPPTGSTTTSA